MRPLYPWHVLALALMAAPLPAAAFDLAVAGGTVQMTDTSPLGTLRLATGPASGGVVPQTVQEGPRLTQVWRTPAPDSTLSMLAPLRTQLEQAGFTIGFACDTQACGGYDFRFGIEVVPAPAMFVDLADFYYLTAARQETKVALVVSRSGEWGYVQVSVVGGTLPAATSVVAPASPPSAPVASTPLAADLDANGKSVLEDVFFATASAELAGEDFASLRALADYLSANPDATVVLVGHTDAVGGLDGNMDLSARRAAAVRRYLTDRLSADAARIDARGIGYLAPRTTNITDAGRTLNRRVEVVLTSTR
jgi:outer membrane protein OmpA-like peptidoglycan-associated protein